MSAISSALERVVTVGKNFSTGFAIESPVGDWDLGATNYPPDVITVQLLLEQVSKARGQTAFDPRGVDGKISRIHGRSGTVKAILAYQRGFMSRPDGLVEPEGRTIKKLRDEAMGAASTAKVATRSIMQAQRANEGIPPWLYDLYGNISKSVTSLIPQPANAQPSWISIAEKELGVDEEHDNDKTRIAEYHLTTKHLPKPGKKALAEETAWCSSFVNWVMRKAGYEGTDSRGSHSWRNWGDEIASPAVGAIAFIDWGPVYPNKPDKQGKGHVGIVAGRTASSRIVLLGGNQGDEVKYAAFKKSHIVSFRVPKGYQVDPHLYQVPLMKITEGGSGFDATR